MIGNRPTFITKKNLTPVLKIIIFVLLRKFQPFFVIILR